MERRHISISLIAICRFLLTVWVLILGAALPAETKPEGTPPLWNKEVQNYNGLAFLDNARLLLYGVNRSGDLSSRESPETSSAFRLQVGLLDVRSGKPVLSETWGTRLYGTDVQVTAGGVLVKAGGFLRLYSPDFRAFRDLPIPQDPNGSFFLSISASGKTIMVSHYFRKNRSYLSQIYVLDAEALNVRDSWEQYPPAFHFSLSDEAFVNHQGGVVSVTDFGSKNRGKPVAVMGDLARGTITELPHSEVASDRPLILRDKCAAGGAGPALVSDDLMVARDCKEVLLLTTAGKSYSLVAFNGNGSTAAAGMACKPYNPAMSAKFAIASNNPQLVALVLPALRIKKPFLAERRTCLDGLTIAVYDLASKKRILALRRGHPRQNGALVPRPSIRRRSSRSSSDHRGVSILQKWLLQEELDYRSL